MRAAGVTTLAEAEAFEVERMSAGPLLAPAADLQQFQSAVQGQAPPQPQVIPRFWSRDLVFQGWDRQGAVNVDISSPATC